MQPTSIQQTAAISHRRAWLLAARPKTLPAAVGPVLVGAALAAAEGRLAPLSALAALACALLLQIGSNVANDYFDYVKGADTADRLGPTRVTAAGLLAPATVRRGMVVIFGLAALVGLYLVWAGGWPILATGLAAILAALAYTGGPKPFGYLGLGDLFVFLFFGPVAVAGTYFVQTHRLTGTALLLSLPVGALITAILVVNNLRDIETDRRAGKMTLAVRLGRAGAQAEYLALMVAAYISPLLVWGALGSPWLLLPWLTAPLALRLLRAVRQETGSTLNASLAGTARLSLLFSLALALGLLL
ncbi:MAG TPA: 1,4-dihydroxy-2-naphthoate polyprenyltransferase [Caldilineaceae bacterium]|nr:1,4-dihydroxy-2-naphthoate polyprenyltransferase [Caldilineaceae bacterium]